MILQKLDDQLRIAYNNNYKIKYVNIGFDIYVAICSELKIQPNGVGNGNVEYSGLQFLYKPDLQLNQLEFVMQNGSNPINYFIY